MSLFEPLQKVAQTRPHNALTTYVFQRVYRLNLGDTMPKEFKFYCQDLSRAFQNFPSLHNLSISQLERNSSCSFLGALEYNRSSRRKYTKASRGILDNSDYNSHFNCTPKLSHLQTLIPQHPSKNGYPHPTSLVRPIRIYQSPNYIYHLVNTAISALIQAE